MRLLAWWKKKGKNTREGMRGAGEGCWEETDEGEANSPGRPLVRLEGSVEGGSGQMTTRSEKHSRPLHLVPEW